MAHKRALNGTARHNTGIRIAEAAAAMRLSKLMSRNYVADYVNWRCCCYYFIAWVQWRSIWAVRVLGRITSKLRTRKICRYIILFCPILSLSHICISLESHTYEYQNSFNICKSHGTLCCASSSSSSGGDNRKVREMRLMSVSSDLYGFAKDFFRIFSCFFSSIHANTLVPLPTSSIICRIDSASHQCTLVYHTFIPLPPLPRTDIKFSTLLMISALPEKKLPCIHMLTCVF